MDSIVFSTVEILRTDLFTTLFGLGYWAFYPQFLALFQYLTIQMVAGLFQSSGCPAVVAMVGNQFCKEEVIYNGYLEFSHFCWDITGSLVASILLKYKWGWSVIVPGILIAFIGMIVFLLLPVYPKSIECNKDEVLSLGKEDEEVNEPLSRSNRERNRPWVLVKHGGFPKLCHLVFDLFFLVAYTFL